jgi:hypothetical protein
VLAEIPSTAVEMERPFVAASDIAPEFVWYEAEDPLEPTPCA